MSDSTTSHSCMLCGDDNSVPLPCGLHHWCEECIIRYFQSMQIEQDYHNAGCSSTPGCQIELHQFQHILPQPLFSSMEARVREWSVAPAQRLYCADPSCSEFIPPTDQQDNNSVQCSKCDKRTCKLCKHLAHEGECVPDADTTQAMHAALADGYKPCPRCSTLIYRTEACPRMQCLCGKPFCWFCLGDLTPAPCACEGAQDWYNNAPLIADEDFEDDDDDDDFAFAMGDLFEDFLLNILIGVEHLMFVQDNIIDAAADIRETILHLMEPGNRPTEEGLANFLQHYSAFMSHLRRNVFHTVDDLAPEQRHARIALIDDRLLRRP